jgi:DNA helicase-2/ATP-dependent DNA helicase PcrA
VAHAPDQKAAAGAVASFQQACRARGLLEEHRLAYVAVTRARELLVGTGYWWDTTTRPRGTSVLLEQLRAASPEAAEAPTPWVPRPRDGAPNPILAAPHVTVWPVDPLGERRAVMEAGAALVRAELGNLAATGPSDGSSCSLGAVVPGSGPPPGPAARAVPGRLAPDLAAGAQPASGLDPGLAARAQAWARDCSLLLAEHARAGMGAGAVDLPAHVSVSQLELLRRDPTELARQIRRPLPARPRPLTRRGTRFHAWLESRWGQQRLLDVPALPGAADDSAEPDADLPALQEAFRHSSWWARTPTEVEFPFEMVIEGLLVRGRIDAVFVSEDGVDVVDWKTGTRPDDAQPEAASVQLAAYRLAWSVMTGTPVDRVRAAVHYVRSNETVRPVDLLGADALAAVIRTVPIASEQHGDG